VFNKTADLKGQIRLLLNGLSQNSLIPQNKEAANEGGGAIVREIINAKTFVMIFSAEDRIDRTVMNIPQRWSLSLKT